MAHDPAREREELARELVRRVEPYMARDALYETFLRLLLAHDRRTVEELRPWIGHLFTCKASPMLVACGEGGACDCGLDDALRARDAKEGKP